MPPFLADPQGKAPDLDQRIKDQDFDYNYPRGLDLKPGSELHEWLRQRIFEYAWEGKNAMSARYDEWNEMDRVLRAYVPVEPHALREYDSVEDKRRKDSEAYQKIIMPTTFANMETLLTYMSAAFLQDPIFGYEGTGPEDVYGAFLMQHTIAQQSHKMAHGLALHTQWRDSFAYGFGAIHPMWYTRMGKIPSVEERGWMDSIRNLFVVTEREPRFKKGVVFEGNKLVNIDPYTFYPDPNVSVNNVQDMEYVCWMDETNYMQLRSREKDAEDFLFNVRYLRNLKRRSSLAYLSQNERDKYASASRTGRLTDPIDVLYAYIDLIPQEWKLGRGKDPETWLFMIAADQVIIAAERVDLNHGLKPVAVCAPDYDGYSPAPASRLMMTIDIQRIVDFLFTSHIANVRKSINDMIVVDPSLINMYDLDNPEPGARIRLRRSAFGRGGIDAAIKQLVVQDVTQGHIVDAQVLTQQAQYALGTDSNLQGIVPKRGERISALETQTARSSGLARLERLAKIIGMQSMQPLGHMLASHTQQFMSRDTYIKVTGEWAERLKNDFGADVEQGRVFVDPMDLIVEYDLKAVDGTIPGSENAAAYLEMLQIAAQSPQLQQYLNIPKLVQHIARHLGAKNIDDFVNIQPKVMDDEQVLELVDKGTLTAAGDGQTGQPPIPAA